MKSDKWYAAMRSRRGKGTNQYTKAVRLGEEKPAISDETREKLRKANVGRKHSDETKQKLSDLRKAYLNDNPDQVPYLLNHKSKGRSYPEQYWKEILDNNGLIYSEQYRIKRYNIDFAFVDQKIALEIDGEQHYVDERIVAHDLKRTMFLEEHGWRVIRVRWAKYQKIIDKETFVQQLLTSLSI